MIQDMINLKDLVDNNNWNLIPTTTGVYTIHNKITDGIYIGSAASKRGFRERLKRHIKDLINNTHANSKLQNSFNKYGIEAFSFNIVELCTKENCIKYEQSWLDFKFGNNCYNICPQAANCKGIKRSKEQVNKRCIKFYCIDLQGNKTYIENIREYARNNNIDQADCYKVAQYKKGQVKGLIFRYADLELDAKYKSLITVAPIALFPKKAKILYPNGQEQIIENGKLEEFERNIIGVSSGILARVCKGNNRCNTYYSYEGYYCDNNGVILPEVALNRIKVNSNNYKTICNKILKQPFVKFENIKTKEIIYSKQYNTTCKLLNLSDSSVADCIAGRIKSTKNWIVTKIYE